MIYLIPLNQVSIFNTVGSSPRGFSQGAQRKLYLRWKKPDCTLEARSDPWQDNPGMALETFSPTIHHRFDSLFSWIIIRVILYHYQQKEKKLNISISILLNTLYLRSERQNKNQCLKTIQ